MLLAFPQALPPEQALVSMVEGDYGFSFVELSTTQAVYDPFSLLQIDRAVDFNVFCAMDNLDEPLKRYLIEIGTDQNLEVVESCAALIHDIALKILRAADKPFAWFSLRASHPTHDFDLPRWHVDGYYYPSREKTNIQYKFITTLIGPSTLFYPIPKKYKKLRQIIQLHMSNRPLMAEICGQVEPYATKRGEGAFLIGSNIANGGFHSEPPTHENRLVLSIVPCEEEEIGSLEKRIMEHYIHQK